MTMRMREIGEIARELGVDAGTLREWERHYGVPASQRDAGGRRLYDDRQVGELRRILAFVDLGERAHLAHVHEAATTPLRCLRLRLAPASDAPGRARRAVSELLGESDGLRKAVLRPARRERAGEERGRLRLSLRPDRARRRGPSGMDRVAGEQHGRAHADEGTSPDAAGRRTRARDHGCPGVGMVDPHRAARDDDLCPDPLYRGRRRGAFARSWKRIRSAHVPNEPGRYP